MYQLFFVWICGLLFSRSHEQVLLKESFNYPNGQLPTHFWSEGCPGVIRNGRLFIDADTVGFRASSVWLDQELKGNLSIEFDVFLLSSSDDANNVNTFFMYRDPSGNSLKQSADLRSDGLYSRYHKLQGYIFTNVTNGDTSNIRYRFRENAGFRLVEQQQMKRADRNSPVHIKITKKANRIRYWEDGHKIFDKTLTGRDKLYEHGLFGFRTWHTALEIDNLIIKKI